MIFITEPRFRPELWSGHGGLGHRGENKFGFGFYPERLARSWPHTFYRVSSWSKFLNPVGGDDQIFDKNFGLNSLPHGAFYCWHWNSKPIPRFQILNSQGGPRWGD